METDKRLELITKDLQEIITKEELKNLLENKKEVSVYWGTMPTGSVSFAYFFPMLKISDFLKANLRVKILIADLHAALDGVRWDLLDKRTKYYKEVIIKILKIIGVDIKKLEILKGSYVQLNKEYFGDLLKLSMLCNIKKCIKAASEVVKMSRHPLLGNLIYPLMQALDEEYLNVDIQYAGLDQRKVMVFAREVLPKIGYRQRVELMSPMIRGLKGEKMSSSIEESKIDLLDDEITIYKKIKNAECIIGNPNNGIMDILKYVIMRLKKDKRKSFIIERLKKYGGDIEYKSYEEIERDFILKKLHPLDLKNAVAKEINDILKNFRKDKKLLSLYEDAYKK